MSEEEKDLLKDAIMQTMFEMGYLEELGGGRARAIDLAKELDRHPKEITKIMEEMEREDPLIERAPSEDMWKAWWVPKSETETISEEEG